MFGDSWNVYVDSGLVFADSWIFPVVVANSWIQYFNSCISFDDSWIEVWLQNHELLKVSVLIHELCLRIHELYLEFVTTVSWYKWKVLWLARIILLLLLILVGKGKFNNDPWQWDSLLFNVRLLAYNYQIRRRMRELVVAFDLVVAGCHTGQSLLMVLYLKINKIIILHTSVQSSTVSRLF